MIEQMQADLSGSRVLPVSRTTSRRPVVAEGAVVAVEPAVTAPRLLLAMIVCLLIPGNFFIVGAQLSPNRVLLLGLLPFMAWRWFRGDVGRPNAVDVCVLLCALWAGLSLVVNHGLGALPRSVITITETFGAYLFGRLFVRNAADYRRFFVLLTIGFAVLLPFAVVEMLTGQDVLRRIFGLIFNIPEPERIPRARLGLTRARTIFEHPILFGLVASMGVANMLYIYRDSFRRSMQLTAFFVFVVFSSISSGPMLSVLVQLALTAWDRLLWFMRFKWLVLGFLGIMAMLLLQIASQFHILDFIIDNLMFNPETAPGRIINFEYGMAEVYRHPVFGIGLGDWVRPWDRPATFDNYWINYWMRFGTPSFALLVLALVISASRIVMQTTLTRREASYRTGYLFTLTGLTITLATVHIWSATQVFVFIYFGMGSWFYMRDPAEGRLTEAVRTRRAAQAQAFAATPKPAATLQPPQRAARTGMRRGRRIGAGEA